MKGRVAIITGAGQGLGRAFAHGFAAQGAVPVIAEINEDKGRAVAAETGGLYVRTDVSDPASVDAMARAVLDAYARIDVLVNNAAIFSTLEMRPFEEIPLEVWERVLRVNLTGPFLCARAVASAMRKAGWGRIINIASAAVSLGRPNYLQYIASKAGLAGMTNSLARELGPHGITVNAILPGATFTEIPRKTVTAEQKKAIVGMQCIQRPEVPEDLVGVVLFLASPASGFVTGQALTVDGGATHRG
jgi:NAD(P)-dependent dehydrogenase (short-subunit alcohol dehydrogenase family)